MFITSFIHKILKKLDVYSPRPRYYAFIMSPSERNLFDQYVKKSKLYLEFGAGGSTLRALTISKAQVYSIDSSQEWINSMHRYWLVRFQENKRLFLKFMDIGPTKEWGQPDGMLSKDLFPNYSSNIFPFLEGKIPDTILIDGRFRVACALQVILHYHGHADTKILIHDFWNRPGYHVLLQYLEVFNQADTLGVFGIKKDVDLSKVKDEYELHKFDFN